jgi:hypothetical protein
VKRLGWRGLLVGLVVGLAIGGTFAWAAIPSSSNGNITACYPTSGTSKGALRVIDYQAGQRCASGQATLTWPSRGFRWRGPWLGSVAYSVNDVVRYNGSAYIARLANTNVVPTNATNWALMVSKGDAGPTGATGAPGQAPIPPGQLVVAPLPGWGEFAAVNDSTWVDLPDAVAAITIPSGYEGLVVASWASVVNPVVPPTTPAPLLAVRFVIDGSPMYPDGNNGIYYGTHVALDATAEGVPAGAHTIKIQMKFRDPCGGCTRKLNMHPANLVVRTEHSPL